jgi:RNA polymerase sigma-70 factor (ECF subfamily)
MEDRATAVGCSLPREELPRRGEDFRQLFARGLKRREVDGARVVWTFAWTPDLERDARALTARWRRTALGGDGAPRSNRGDRDARQHRSFRDAIIHCRMTPARRREIHAAMVRFADGDRAAFREVFDALWPVLLSFTSRTLAARADAEDAAQRALLKVFDRIIDLDRSRDGVAWAITIAAYEVMTVRRELLRRREQSADALVAVADGQPSPAEHVVREDLHAAVREAIGELPARDQAALAELLDDTVSSGETERKRRFRAIERLRALWRKVHG